MRSIFGTVQNIRITLSSIENITIVNHLGRGVDQEIIITTDVNKKKTSIILFKNELNGMIDLLINRNVKVELVNKLDF